MSNEQPIPLSTDEINFLRRGTNALALQVPASVFDAYAPSVHAALDELLRLRVALRDALDGWEGLISSDYPPHRMAVALGEIERLRPLAAGKDV